MRCSIVIRAFNEAKHLPRLLTGISQQTIRDVEVILVDSGSADRTVEIASGFGAKVVHISPDEFTFGRSLNLGIEVATAPFIVIVSAHVYPVYPDWLERLLAPFADPKIVLTYGKQRGGETTRFSEHQVFAQWFPEHSDPWQAHPFCNNANAALRRAAWQKHPYDETLTGLEDVAWANWALHEGYALAYIAEAEIIHLHDETPQGVYSRYRREAMAFKRIFPNEYSGLWALFRLVSINVLNDLVHTAQSRVVLKNLVGIFWFRWMQFWGTYQGYPQSGPLTWQLRQAFYYPRGVGVTTPGKKRDIAPIHYEENAGETDDC